MKKTIFNMYFPIETRLWALKDNATDQACNIQDDCDHEFEIKDRYQQHAVCEICGYECEHPDFDLDKHNRRYCVECGVIPEAPDPLEED